MKSNTRTFRFGPGALESLVVKAFSGRRRYVTGQKVATVEGTFRVYAASGEYTVDIAERFSGFDCERAHNEDTDLVFRAAAGDAEAAAELAGNAVEYALVDWFDPAEECMEEAA